MRQTEIVSAYADLLTLEQWKAIENKFRGIKITGPFMCLEQTCHADEMHIAVPDWKTLAKVEIAIRKQSPPETKNQPFFPHG